MSSFFTLPASQRKRKRVGGDANRPVKRRGVESDAKTRHSDNEKVRRKDRDDSISGSESEDDASVPDSRVSEESSADEDETAGERRLRLAQRYLDNIAGGVDEAGFDAADIDRDLIAQRLKLDADEAKGLQFRLIATTLNVPSTTRTFFRADTQSTTSVTICAPYAYTVSKDKTLIKWQLPLYAEDSSDQVNGRPRQRKPKQLKYVRGVRINASTSQQHGHTGSILAVAASPDGSYVATGGADRKLIIWSAKDLKPLKTFPSHRDSITDLSFAPNSSQAGVGSQLFSTSMDRTLKTFSLNGDDSLAYVETLFGHQDHVLAVAAMTQDQCVSVGARDRTARLWKVVEETQLVFRGDSSKKDSYTTGSIDCVAAIPPANFVTGSDAGTISLWSMHKKKPLFTIQAAHGVDPPEPLEKITSEKDESVIEELKKSDYRAPQARAITALASVPGTDVVLSGSWEGRVKIWKVSDDKRSLIEVGTIGCESINMSSQDAPETNGTNGVTKTSAQTPIKGVVNSIAVLDRRRRIENEFGGTKEGETIGLCIVIGTGKELRLGRWMKFPHGRNGAMLLEVPVLYTKK